MRTSGWAPSALVYTAVTVILGRDVLARLGTTIANDPGDPLLTAAILHWNAYQVPYTDAWWQFPIFHPTRDTLTFSEHLLGLGVIATPLAWISGNPLAAYNLTLLLTFPLCGLAMYALVHHLTRSPAAAFLAGLAYAFAPFRISNLPHIQMLASFWAPLALLGLHRFVDAVSADPAGPAAADPDPQDVRDAGARRHGTLPSLRRPGSATGGSPVRWLALFGACWALQAASNWYTLVLFSIFLALWVLWFVVVPRRWRALAAIAGAAAAAAVPLAPIVYRYLSVHALHGFERTVAEMRTYSADVSAVLCAPPALTAWGWIDVFCRAEGELFPGVALFALSAAGLFVALRPGPRDRARDEWLAPRALRFVTLLLLAVCGLYALVVASVLAFGPWRMPLVGISASSLDKPLLVALAAGVLAVLLALAPHAWRRSGSPLSFYLFAAVATWLLALGPTITLVGESSGRPGPFALLQWLPGISGLRVPARFWLMTVLCLAVVAGYAAADILARRRRVPAMVVIGVLAMALLADGWMPGIPAQPPPPAIADAGALRGRIVLQLPLEPYADIAATWRAVVGGWQSVNGYSGHAPNYYNALTVAAQRADPAMFEPFRRDDDLHVVAAGDQWQALVARQPGAVPLARGDGFTRYLLPRQPSSAVSPLRTIPIASLRSPCAGETAAAAGDGNERTRWTCLEGAEAHRLLADLGVPGQVAGIAYSVGRESWNVPTELAVDTSLDGTVWQTVNSGSVLGAFIRGGIDDHAALRATVRFAPHAARYVRIRPVNQREDFGWFVAEIEVLGP